MFKFSTRDLLWLIVAVALALGWWLHQSRLKAQVSSLKGNLCSMTRRAAEFANENERLQNIVQHQFNLMGFYAHIRSSLGYSVIKIVPNKVLIKTPLGREWVLWDDGQNIDGWEVGDDRGLE